MDDGAALKRSSEIVLANELPFSLAGSLVRPAALEVEHGAERIALEPRVMQVLVALHRGAGDPVSRDSLITLCWGGRVVTEGALNRCVAQLRKALVPNPLVRVETIPKVGYRLRVEINASNGAPARNLDASGSAAPDLARNPGEASVGTIPPSKKKWLRVIGAAVAGAVTIALLSWLVFTPHRIYWGAASYRPLTSDAGIEIFPALSPDGEQLVYSAAPFDPSSTTDLYLRNVDQGSPLRLTSTDTADEFGAAWSPKGNLVAFVRTPADGPCEIVVIPIPRGAERVVTRCNQSRQTSVSWIDDHTVTFADQPGPNELSRIRAVNIKTGALRDLTSPLTETVGDFDPVVSPNGRYIVFHRTLVPGADDLFVLDRQTREERPLTQDGWKAGGYAWSSDSRSVFFSSNRGGEFGLWSADLERPGKPRQVTLGLGAINFTHLSSDHRNRLAVEIFRGRTNLARVGADGRIEPITTGNGSEWEPASAPDGSLAYISSRSGSYQIWLLRPGSSESVRVTSLLASYMTSPAWSPDGRTIAFVAVTGRRAEIYTIAPDGSQMRQITNDAYGKRDPVYSSSGDSIFYVARVGGAWHLMQLALTPGAKPRFVPGGEGWRILRKDISGHLYGQRGNSILTLDPSAPRAEVRLSDVDVWTVAPQGIYVRHGRAPSRPSTIDFYPWNGPPRKAADTSLASSNISVDSRGGVLFSQSPVYEIDLGLLELRP